MALSDTFRILQDIIHLMATNANGISSGEIAETFGISTRVVSKYITILENAGIPLYAERKRYFLDENYFGAFKLSDEESEFLYLLLERSLVLHSDRWQTTQSLLNKLGNKLTVPLSDYLLSKMNLVTNERVADKIFKLLVKAKRQNLEIWVQYLPLRHNEPSLWLIRPYRFTSNYYSDGLYILAHGSRDQETFIPLSLKLDRILDVELSKKRFSVADMARFNSTLGNAWSVWSSKQKPVLVELLFEPRHYDRLLETIWHDTQRIHVGKNDYVHYFVEVSEPEEMIPWIRSWGSGVVVLEPNSLRQHMIRSVHRLAQAYGLYTDAAKASEDPSAFLWAKYDRISKNYHLLICHLLDTAAVAWQMWEFVLSEAQRRWLSELLGIDYSKTRRLVALLVGLHDIGKASPAFQSKARPLYERLLESGFAEENSFDVAHGVLSAIILERFLLEAGMDKYTSNPLALVIGGHHGSWVNNTSKRNDVGAVGAAQWREMQRSLMEQLTNILGVESLGISLEGQTLNAFATFLSGFVSVCDWIGSDERYFSYVSMPVNPQVYFAQALVKAQDALHGTGWFGWKAAKTWKTFQEIFPFPPNSMQERVIETCDFSEGKPRLILLEYPTGAGKTEIALYLADLLINRFELSGIYVAMPTQATSNQLFERMSKYLESRYPQQVINLHLIHAQAEQQDLYRQLQAQPEREGDESNLVARKWFQSRRRALLAPFAVGTVDQAMLAVLQTKHHFVRQYALSQKVIIFDEIHAYDSYMNQIIERLFNWLDTLQSPVILLSATLSQKSREDFLKQFGVNSISEDETAYPRLTIVDQHRNVHIHHLPSPISRRVKLAHIERENLLDYVKEVYQQGGCIAIICNTVDAAIDLARLMKNSPYIDEQDVMLFHARSPYTWRQSTEKAVLERFGKQGQRPKRMILVATQIIEQSLDLDFDLIISEYAPIDLLIQRAGRLHRHPREQRPAHLIEPALFLIAPHIQDGGLADFGVNAVIYEKYMLLQTWLQLHNRQDLHIPEEIDYLMNSVYRPFSADDVEENALNQALQDAYIEMTSGENGQIFKSEQYCIKGPENGNLIGWRSDELSDDEQFPIATRDIEARIDIVCMQASNASYGLPAYVETVPTQAEKERLLMFKLSINKRDMLDDLDKLEPHPYWERIPQLRFARPIIFDGETARIPNSKWYLRLSRFYGLEFIEEKI